MDGSWDCSRELGGVPLRIEFPIGSKALRCDWLGSGLRELMKEE